MRRYAAVDRSVRFVVFIGVLFASLPASAQTQDGGSRAATEDCLCGNENGTPFPPGQCFLNRTCGAALAETGGEPCTGSGQGNCPAGQYCLDANNACGVATCALQTTTCQGSCNAGDGTAPYEACTTIAPAFAMPATVVGLIAVSLMAGAVVVLRRRRAAAPAIVITAVLVTLLATFVARTVTGSDQRPCRHASVVVVS